MPILLGVDPLQTAASPFYRLLVQALRGVAGARGFRTDLYAGFAGEGRGRWDESAARDSLNEQVDAGLVRGILLITGWEVNAYFKARGVPLVSVQSYVTPGARAVGVHGEKLAALGVGELNRHGRHKVWMVGSIADGNGVKMMRVPGVSEVFDPYSGGFNPEATPHEERGYQIGCELVERLRKNAGAFDSLLITDDLLARGVLVALTRAGVALGREVVVATHVNKGSAVLVGYQHDLIQLEIDPAEIAEKMLAMLDAQIAGDHGERVDLVAPRLILPLRETA
jgi:DNA-binding LacI/PurR family transcriptional regulator